LILGYEILRDTPERIAWLSVFLGVSLAITAVLYSLAPSFSMEDGELFHLPKDDQLYASMVSYLEGKQASEEELASDLPPLASYLGGIKENIHTVTRGDTLSELALKYDVKIGTLISYNGIEDVRRIVPGTRLKIPSHDGVRYVVRPGDNLSNIAAGNGISVNQVLDANNLESALIKPGDVLFLPGAAISDYDYKKATGTLIIYPTKGRLTSPYGYRSDPFTGLRRFHYGIDIANGTGTAIIAAMDGVVLSVENRPAGYGRYVVIKHDRGYQTLYGHMNTISVREGQRVRQGQSLGTMGNTGRSTGSHLHFALYKNNRPVDPLSVLH
jgi:LysM repeat protein